LIKEDVGMRKIKSLYLLLVITLLMSFLFSCADKPVAGPVNINYDLKTYTLNWDKVNKATHYILDINGILYESETNEYSFRESDKGLYRVKIKAVFKNKESIYSNTITFVVSDNVKLLMYSDGESLYWEAVDGATYEINYFENLALKTVIVTQNVFPIPQSLKEGVNEIRLKVYMEEKVISDQTITLDYNMIRIFKNSPYIIRAYKAKEVYMNGSKAYGVSVREENVRLSPSLISKHGGETYISVSGEENVMKRVLILPEPYELESFYIQPYVGEDVKYKFSFKDYVITKIEGLNVNVDYRIEVFSTLVINKDYINRYIENNPTASKIGLKVSLTSNGINEELYLEIDLNKGRIE